MEMNNLGGIIFAIAAILMGIGIIAGTYYKVPFLVNPDEKDWYFNSQAFVRKLVGLKGLLFYNYFIGIMLIVAALFGIVNSISKL